MLWFDPAERDCLQPQKFIFYISLSQEQDIALSHSCLSYLISCSELALLKLQPHLLQQQKLHRWSNTRSNATKSLKKSFKNKGKKKKKVRWEERDLGEGLEQLCDTESQKAEMTMFPLERRKL